MIMVRWHIFRTVDCVIIGPGNGLSPVRLQAITCTNAEWLFITPISSNNSIEIKTFSSKNAAWQMSAICSIQCVNKKQRKANRLLAIKSHIGIVDLYKHGKRNISVIIKMVLFNEILVFVIGEERYHTKPNVSKQSHYGLKKIPELSTLTHFSWSVTQSSARSVYLGYLCCFPVTCWWWTLPETV